MFPSPFAKGVSDTLCGNLPLPCSPHSLHTCAHTWLSLAVLALMSVSEEEDTVALSLACKPALPRSIPHPARFTHLTGSQCISLRTLFLPLTPLPLAVSWKLSSWGRAAQPSAFPHRCLSRQQVRPDHWGVCWRLHPDAADPNMPIAPEY